MKKPSFIIVFLFLGLSACINPIRAEKNVSPINQLLEGKWNATGNKVINNVSYLTEFNVNFLSNSKLKYCSKSLNSSFCEEFTYQYLDENTYLVENERAQDGKWIIQSVDETLLICIWTDDSCYEFIREND
jgi:hypothetical protein